MGCFVRKCPSSKSAPEILISLKDELGGWRHVEKHLGINRGYLSAIAHGKRKPSNKVLLALGLPLQHVEVTPCARCGQLHAFQRRCPGSASKYAPHPVMRVSKIKRILNSPYKDS